MVEGFTRGRGLSGWEGGVVVRASMLFELGMCRALGRVCGCNVVGGLMGFGRRR